jgi:MFS family permease
MKLFRPSRLVLLLLCLMYFITYLDRVNVSTAAAGFARDFNLSKTQIGLVFSGFAYPYLLFQIIGGWVSDRFGARRTLIACGALWALATALTGFSTGLVTLMAARLLLGLGEGATFPAATSAMARWVAVERRGFAQGITHAAARIGNAVAPTAIVWLMLRYGWRASFFACAVLSGVWVLLWALVFTERPHDHPRISSEELAVLPAAGAPRPRAPWGPLFARMWPVTIVYFCYGWTLWLFLSWIPQYFLHSHQLDLQSAAYFASSVFAAGVLGDTLGGVVTDFLLRRSGSLYRARSQMVALCMLGSLLSLTAMLFSSDLYVCLIALSSGFFFAEMCIGPMWAIPMDVAPDFAGTASGMMNTGSAFAAIVSPLVSGLVIDLTGNWTLPFVGSMVLMGVGVVLALRMQPGNRFELDPSDLTRAASLSAAPNS